MRALIARALETQTCIRCALLRVSNGQVAERRASGQVTVQCGEQHAVFCRACVEHLCQKYYRGACC